MAEEDDDFEHELPDDQEDGEFDPAFGFALEALPEELHSSYSGEPFATCIECERPLQNPSSPHLIQKVRRDGEVIYEFALCMPCAERTDEGMSEESRRNVQRWFEENTLAGIGRDRCNICGEARDDEEHVVVAMAVGGGIVGGGHAFCSKCTEQLEAILSEPTRRQMEDFTRRNFPGVPENIGLPSGVFAL